MIRSALAHAAIAAFIFLSALSVLPAFASAAASTPSFSQNLQLWDRGADIQSLQQFLNAQGFLVAQSGPGSPGHETTVFGLLTYHALLKYQAAHDLPATGYFGPMTRASAASSAGNSSTAQTTSVSNNVQGGAASSNSSTQSSTASPAGISLSSAGFGGGGGGTSIAPSASCSLSAVSPTVTLGDSSLLTWSTTNAVSASLSAGIGAVAPSGSTNVTPGATQTYTLTVTNNQGSIATCETTVTVIGSGDTTPPVVSLTAPTGGATVGGLSVALSATASDNVAVAYVQFKYATSTLTNIGSAILSSPYATTWNSTGVPDGSYTLYAVAADTSGNLATSSETVTVRNTPPVLSSISAAGSYTTATTTWTTDEAAKSKVVYGLTTGYGSASSSASIVTSHSILLSGLTASSTYHFEVVSTDAGGNTATSSDGTFTTAATSTPPVISSISNTATTTSATVTWSTNLSASSEVVWGLTTGYGSASSSPSLVTSHSITLTGLATSTTYDYEVVSATTFGATATSTNQTLTTASGAPDTSPPTEPTNLLASPESSSQVALSWTTSTDNVGVVGYQVFRDGTQVATDTSGTTYNDIGLSPSSLHSYWVDAYDAADNISTSTTGVAAETDAGADQYGTTWKPLRIGAGGYITGIDIAPDGTKVIRTDTYGAYLWDGTQWDQLISSSTMPTGLINTQVDGTGVYEIAIAPSNSNILYMEYQGYVFKSANRGATWTKTNLAQVTDASNDSYRFYGRKMAVDPVNPNVVYAGTPGQGVFVTSNGGTSWSEVTGIATSTTPGYEIAFDPTAATSTGTTQGIYIASYGTGVYHSTNGGSTWTLTSGTPTTFSHMVVAQDGVLYLADNVDNNLQIYSSGTWSDVSVGSNGNPLFAVAVDPSNADRIIVANQAGNLSISTNHAGSFTGYDTDNMTFTANDIPWLAGVSEASSFMSTGDITFDPSASNTLYQSDGIGVWVANPANTDASTAWTSQTKGIEQLVATEIVSPPGGQPVLVSEDRAFFYVTNPDVFPSSYGPTESNLTFGGSADWASNDPSYLVGATWSEQSGATQSAYSTNGGQSWSYFGSYPGSELAPGSIAAASSTDIVWLPSNSTDPYYSINGGSTWTAITTATSTGWSNFLDRQVVAADRVNIGTFYMYTNDNLYRSTNGGVTWSEIQSSFGNPFGGYNVKLRSVPNKAGELFFTGGPQTPDSTSSPQDEPFLHSTNSGTSWSSVPNVLEVTDFGFGKAAPGTTTPAIYIIGFVNNKYGIYEFDDDANTWTQVGLWPVNSLDIPKTISGDMNAYGRVYVGFNGSGYAYGNTANAQIPPIISSISSGTPTTTAATITWTTDQSSNSEVVYGTTTNYGSASSSASLVTSHSITLSGLSSGTTYHYEVVSVDSSGYTATSTDQTFTTYNSIPPSVPTGLVATPVSSSGIDLSWATSTGDGTYAVAGYQIFRNSVQVGTSTVSTTFADTGLSSGTSYSYAVNAYDTEGNVSAQSGSVSTSTESGVTFTPTADPATQYIAYGSNTAVFSNVSIGAPSASRIVVVGATGDQACAPTSVSIGGTSATLAVQTATSSGSYHASLWYAATSSGSTANITLTCSSGAIDLVGIAVGALTGTATSGPATTALHASDFTSDPQVVPTTGTITVPSNGAAVMIGAGGDTGNNTITWTNTTNTAGDFYSATSTRNGLSSLIAHSYAAGSESYSVAGSVGNGFGYSGFAGVVAAWGP